jgi:hypothetical protein
MVILECGHAACHYDMTKYIEICSEKRFLPEGLKCPMAGCD